jgi:hypothetical protein
MQLRVWGARRRPWQTVFVLMRSIVNRLRRTVHVFKLLTS